MLQDVDSTVLIAQEVERDKRAVTVPWLHPHIVDSSQDLLYIRTVSKHLLVTHVFQLSYLPYDTTLIIDTVEIVDNLCANGD